MPVLQPVLQPSSPCLPQYPTSFHSVPPTHTICPPPPTPTHHRTSSHPASPCPPPPRAAHRAANQRGG